MGHRVDPLLAGLAPPHPVPAGGREASSGSARRLWLVQTSPTGGDQRDDFVSGKDALLDALCELPGDVALFHMSTAEVYGAPPGAPYREDHDKQPVNDYGRMKWREEQHAVAANTRPTATGVLRVTALRTWTIVMVDRDDSGAIVSTRNYNDPLVMVSARLGRAGVRVPLVAPGALGQFHPSAEVAEVVLCLGTAAPDAPCWGRAYNCTGEASSHRDIADACYDVFAEQLARRPWWALPVRVVTGNGRVPAPLLRLLVRAAERAGERLGARDMAGRIPFLYRSTHLDARAIRADFGDRLSDPIGATAVTAVRELALGVRNGGAESTAERRYRNY